MILVVGATGLLGSEICDLLAARGKRVRALTRGTCDPARRDRLRALGAEVVPGDLRDAGSPAAACQGVSTVITTASALPIAYQPEVNTPQITDPDGYLSLIAAARDAGPAGMSGSMNLFWQTRKRHSRTNREDYHEL